MLRAITLQQFRQVRILAFLVLSGGLTLSCSPEPLPTIDGLVPPESVAGFRTAPLDTLANPLQAFVETIPGGMGLFGYLEERAGIQLLEQNGVEDFGLEPKLGVHGFWLEGHGYIVAGVRDSANFKKGIGNWLRKGREGIVLEGGSGPLDFHALMSSRAKDDPGMFCGMVDRVFGCTWGQEGQEAFERLGVVLRRPLAGGSFWTNVALIDEPSPEPSFTVQARFLGGEAEDYRLIIDQMSGKLLSNLGPARFLLAAVPAFFKELKEGVGSLELQGGRITAAFEQEMPEKSLEQLKSVFQFGRDALVYEWLPRDTAFVARLHVDPDGLLSLFNAMKKFIPDTSLRSLHPMLSKAGIDTHFLNHWGGELTFAFLGLGKDFRTTMMARPSLMKWLKVMDVAVIFTLRDTPEFLETWSGYSLSRSAYEFLAIPALEGEPAGGRLRSASGKGLSVAFVPKGNHLLAIAGREAYPLVRDVMEGRRTSLKQRMESKRFNAREQEGANGMSFYVGPGGLMRSLAQRGMPGFFLTQISRIYEMWGFVGLDGQRLVVETEVRQ